MWVELTLGDGPTLVNTDNIILAKPASDSTLLKLRDGSSVTVKAPYHKVKGILLGEKRHESAAPVERPDSA